MNLERSMAATDRNSGHFVQGHVDEAGRILKFTPEGDSLWRLHKIYLYKEDDKRHVICMIEHSV